MNEQMNKKWQWIIASIPVLILVAMIIFLCVFNYSTHDLSEYVTPKYVEEYLVNQMNDDNTISIAINSNHNWLYYNIVPDNELINMYHFDLQTTAEKSERENDISAVVVFRLAEKYEIAIDTEGKIYVWYGYASENVINIAEYTVLIDPMQIVSYIKNNYEACYPDEVLGYFYMTETVSG